MAIRGPKKQFEMVWRGAKSYGSSADVLTGNFASGMAPRLTGYLSGLTCCSLWQLPQDTKSQHSCFYM